MKLYNTPKGKFVVFYNSNGAREEYAVVSLFCKGSVVYFAQLVGRNNPKHLLPGTRTFDVVKAKLGEKNTYLFTCWCKTNFNYQFPFPEEDYRVIIAPTSAAAEKIFKDLVGVDDSEIIRRHFAFHSGRDMGSTDRVALYIRQIYSATPPYLRGKEHRLELLEEFLALDRKPVLFKGGEIDGIH